MSTVFELRRRLGSHEHVTLVQSQEPSRIAFFISGQAFALTLQVQGFKALGAFRGQVSPRRPP